MIISKRLETIVQMLRPAGVLADIGCDHGFVSIHAVQNGIAGKVIAADVAKGPLEAAQKNARMYGTLEKTEFILSDGLKSIPTDADLGCVVIAGMGGILIKNILEAAKLSRFPNLSQLVLGPQSDLELVRHYLIDEMHFCIREERCVYDEGKYYMLFDVDTKHCEMYEYSEADYLFGKHILEQTRETYCDYLNFRIRVMTEALGSVKKGSSEKSLLKVIELEKTINLAKTALKNAGGQP